MKKYSFRLNNVLRVRRVQEDIAKSELLSANGDVQSAINAVEQRVDAYISHSPGVGRATVDTFMRQRYFNELAGNAILAAKASHAAAVAVADIKRMAFSDAARQTKAIERLDERSRDDYKIEYQREMDREMDEISTGRFTRTGSSHRKAN